MMVLRSDPSLRTTPTRQKEPATTRGFEAYRFDYSTALGGDGD